MYFSYVFISVFLLFVYNLTPKIINEKPMIITLPRVEKQKAAAAWQRLPASHQPAGSHRWGPSFPGVCPSLRFGQPPRQTQRRCGHKVEGEQQRAASSKQRAASSSGQAARVFFLRLPKHRNDIYICICLWFFI